MGRNENPFSNSIQKPSLTEEISTSQNPVVIKLIKKNMGKRLIKNWSPNSLSNVDSTLLSKPLANRLQDVMPNLAIENPSF